MKEIDLLLILAFNRDLHYLQMRKLATKLMRKAGQNALNGALKELTSTRSTGITVTRILDEAEAFGGIFKEFSDAGYVGMLVINNEAYPIDIKLLEKSDRDYALTHEGDIQLAAAHSALNVLGREMLTCTVVLFRNRGFSGRGITLTVTKPVARPGSPRVSSSHTFIPLTNKNQRVRY